MNYYINSLKKYADFSGRARRMEFGMFMLINVIIAVILSVIDGALGTMFLGIIFNLAVMVPSIALSARRLHDMNWSGWWQLLFIIPLVGLVLGLIMLFKGPTEGDNRFGANPKNTSTTNPDPAATNEVAA